MVVHTSTSPQISKKKKGKNKNPVTLDEIIEILVCDLRTLDLTTLKRYARLFERKVIQDKLKREAKEAKVLEVPREILQQIAP